MIRTHTVSRDDSIYEAFPDVALMPSGKLLCVFSERRPKRSDPRVLTPDLRLRSRERLKGTN